MAAPARALSSTLVFTGAVVLPSGNYSVSVHSGYDADVVGPLVVSTCMQADVSLRAVSENRVGSTVRVCACVCVSLPVRFLIAHALRRSVRLMLAGAHRGRRFRCRHWVSYRRRRRLGWQRCVCLLRMHQACSRSAVW